MTEGTLDIAQPSSRCPRCTLPAGSSDAHRQVSWLPDQWPASPSHAENPAQWRCEAGPSGHSCRGSWGVKPHSLFMAPSASQSRRERPTYVAARVFKCPSEGMQAALLSRKPLKMAARNRAKACPKLGILHPFSQIFGNSVPKWAKMGKLGTVSLEKVIG